MSDKNSYLILNLLSIQLRQRQGKGWGLHQTAESGDGPSHVQVLIASLTQSEEW